MLLPFTTSPADALEVDQEHSGTMTTISWRLPGRDPSWNASLLSLSSFWTCLNYSIDALVAMAKHLEGRNWNPRAGSDHVWLPVATPKKSRQESKSGMIPAVETMPCCKTFCWLVSTQALSWKELAFVALNNQSQTTCDFFEKKHSEPVSIFDLLAFLPREVEPKSFFCIPQATRKLLTGCVFFFKFLFCQ